MITEKTTLGELQELLKRGKVRLQLCSQWYDGDLCFVVDDFASLGEPFPSRTGVLYKDLAAALEEAVYGEVEGRSPVGLRIAEIP